MIFIRKVLSFIVFAVSLVSVMLLVSILADNSIESDEKIFGSIFFIVIGVLTFFLAQWLWSTPSQVNLSTLKSLENQDSVVVKVPTGIQYELKLSSPDPATQAPENLSSQYEFKVLPGFPRSLFFLENYNNGWKFLVAFFLALSTIYFLTGFPGFLSIQNDWSVHKTSGFIPFIWNSIFGNGASSKISSTVDLFVRFFIFICNYCLAWIVFDPKDAEGYAMGFFNALVGIVYMFAPLDVVPDFVPFVGTLDDTFLGAGMLLLGASSWYRAKLRDTNTDTVLQLINEGNNGRAIQLLLKDKGVAVQNKKREMN